MPSLTREPAHALLQEQHADAQNPSRDQLQPDGDLPLPVGGLDVFLDGVVDPVRGHDAEGEEELEQTA